MPDIFIIVLSVLTSALVCYISIPYLIGTAGPDRTDAVIKIVKAAVDSTEQTLKDVDGEIKKAEAVKTAKEVLNGLGISADDRMLDMLIEAAVFSMNNASAKNTF